MRALTLGELLAEAARLAIDPTTVVITVNGQIVAAGSGDYEITHQVGGVVVAFDPNPCDC